MLERVNKRNNNSQETLSILDSLRAIAAMMVCLYHSAFLLAPFFPNVSKVLDFGQEGVYVFFVISGVVMPWSMEKVGYRVSDFFVFMGKRLLRLHPPMMLSAVIVALTSWTMLNTAEYNGWQLLVASVTLTAPFFELPWVNGIYWTLFVEMQYYIYIALAFPLLTSPSIVKRSLTVAILLALSFCSLAMPGNAAKANLPFHLPVFLMGYYLFMKFKRGISEKEFWFGLITCSLVCAYLTGILHGLGFRIVLTALCTSLIICITRSGWEWLGKIGEVSYSLYLMHWPIISAICFFLGGILKTAWGNTIVFVCIQVTAVLFAFVYYKIIEKPSLHWAKNLKYKRC